MSFAGRGIYAHNRAVLAAYNEGVLSVVASGNDDRKHHHTVVMHVMSWGCPEERITPGDPRAPCG